MNTPNSNDEYGLNIEFSNLLNFYDWVEYLH